MKGKRSSYHFEWEWPTLPEDADEVLLGLLARDNEPCATHDEPYREEIRAAKAEAARVAWLRAKFKLDEPKPEPEPKTLKEAVERAMRADWRARSEAAADMRNATTRLGYRPLAALTVPVSIAEGWPGYWSLTFEVPPK